MNKQLLVEAMNELVIGTCDEDIIDSWITTVPDTPTDEDFKFIADNEDSFKETVRLFIKLSKYFKDGIYIDNKFYK